MPAVYGISLATPGNLTTNGSANTETETFFTKPGSSRPVGIKAIYVQGKGAGLTAISGISFRLLEWATASTSGTSITPKPRAGYIGAAVATAASRPTSGTTRTNHGVFGCGAASPNSWIATEPDDVIWAEAANAKSLSMMDVSGTVSLNFEFSGVLLEQ